MADAGSTGSGDDRDTDQEHHRVAQVIRDEVARIDSPEAADAVAREVEALAGGATQGQRADDVARDPATAGQAVQTAAEQGPGTSGTAAALTEAAAQVVAPTPESPAVAQAVAATLPPQDAAEPTATRRGHRLLREALLRRMRPLQALDTRVFLAINGLPHPPAANLLADTITIVTTGGWIWLLGLEVTRLAGFHQQRGVLRLAAPSIIGATWFVEVPIKALFQRRRPFIDVVRALVVGRRPDGWSFPSGHSAAAFAGAWMLTTLWPSRAPIFFALAASVGFSRVYAGAHYPSDVISGATIGAIVAEAIRRPVARVLH